MTEQKISKVELDVLAIKADIAALRDFVENLEGYKEWNKRTAHLSSVIEKLTVQLNKDTALKSLSTAVLMMNDELSTFRTSYQSAFKEFRKTYKDMSEEDRLPSAKQLRHMVSNGGIEEIEETMTRLRKELISLETIYVLAKMPWLVNGSEKEESENATENKTSRSRTKHQSRKHAGITAHGD